MPTTYADATVELLDYSDFLDYAANSLQYDGQTEMLQHISQELRANPYNAQSSLTTHEQWAESIMQKLRDNGYEIQYNGNNQWTGSVFPTTPQVNNTNPVNSNISTIARGKIRNFYGGMNEFDPNNMQFWKPQRFPVSGGLGSKAMYAITSVGSAISAVSTGIWLGKTIDSALYNANPDYWNSIGMSTLNPETWNGMVNGDDSPFAGLFNFILGIDGTNGTAQAYMDQNLLAYMALALKNAGWFNTGNEYVINNPNIDGITGIVGPLNVGKFTLDTIGENASGNTFFISSTPFAIRVSDGAVCYLGCRTSYLSLSSEIVVTHINGATNHTIAIDAYPSTPANIILLKYDELTGKYSNVASTSTSKIEYNNKQFLGGGAFSATQFVDLSDITSPTQPTTADITKKVQYAMLYADATGGQSVDGVGNQPNAQLPDTTNWNDIPSTLQSLQNQYPDAFQNPMIWNTDTPFDSDTGHQTVYIPVPFPMATSGTDTQPVSATQTQTNTQIGNATQPIQDLITKTAQQTNTQPATPPSNPTDTGTGNTPTPTAPTGNASALWSVYHPTQAQVNSFGAWLWGSPFLTNIGKLFQNPIDGVISLHKIYATPVDSGTGNIVVGTLDSGVSSATVNQQYVTVDCGSINCYEDFGNVFDYEPYTKLSLYLPFIGIVPLNVSDVMRSTIHIVYGVDVYTGACIAMIEISRDGNTINMYQYTGNCAVHYPLSNVQQSNLISGLLGIAAGVGSVLATGGVSAPAVLGIAGGALASGHTSIGRSGGFSANAGAMGIKVPYLIIERPQTKVAETFPVLDGYPTNYSIRLGDCSNHVVCKTVHVSGINATDSELLQIEQLLREGVEV